ncbi:acetylcholine receptor subunit delta-like [Anopheles ziemanni]|uniref:acetylcholine receptor subunit delta-like n=1 Tax=Anopheles coustani TaxID=139045 RepID=UPI002658C365|nr:acetylcholine receptor subunit delta-like [Anopheles coustani]XP_058177583.1 acetylcholine receptor subunit delta-like [Anopheles ziemanni]
MICVIAGIICDKDPSNQEQALKKHLFCNGYNAKEPPTDVLNVTTYFTIRAMHLIDYVHRMLVFTDHGLVWIDDHLSWNASEWYNITVLKLKQDEIWMPKIMTFDNSVSKAVAANLIVLLTLFICWLSSMMHERLVLLLVSLYCHYGLLEKVLIISYIITFILFVVTLFNRWLHSAQDSAITNEWIGNMSKNRAMEFILNADYLNFDHKVV